MGISLVRGLTKQTMRQTMNPMLMNQIQKEQHQDLIRQAEAVRFAKSVKKSGFQLSKQQIALIATIIFFVIGIMLNIS